MEDYTAQQFFSELGGAAGLVLGISLISIIRNGGYSCAYQRKNTSGDEQSDPRFRMIDYSISMTVERIIMAQNMILESFQPESKKTSQSTQVEPLFGGPHPGPEGDNRVLDLY